MSTYGFGGRVKHRDHPKARKPTRGVPAWRRTHPRQVSPGQFTAEELAYLHHAPLSPFADEEIALLIAATQPSPDTARPVSARRQSGGTRVKHPNLRTHHLGKPWRITNATLPLGREDRDDVNRRPGMQPIGVPSTRSHRN